MRGKKDERGRKEVEEASVSLRLFLALQRLHLSLIGPIWYYIFIFELFFILL